MKSNYNPPLTIPENEVGIWAFIILRRYTHANKYFVRIEKYIKSGNCKYF